jgi:hypothetical protein
MSPTPRFEQAESEHQTGRSTTLPIGSSVPGDNERTLHFPGFFTAATRGNLSSARRASAQPRLAYGIVSHSRVWFD